MILERMTEPKGVSVARCDHFKERIVAVLLNEEKAGRFRFVMAR